MEGGKFTPPLRFFYLAPCMLIVTPPNFLTFSFFMIVNFWSNNFLKFLTTRGYLGGPIFKTLGCRNMVIQNFDLLVRFWPLSRLDRKNLLTHMRLHFFSSFQICKQIWKIPTRTGVMAQNVNFFSSLRVRKKSNFRLNIFCI